MRFLLKIAIIAILTGCNSRDLTKNNSTTYPEPDIPPVTTGNWYKPPVLSTWQWQLEGVVNTTYDVDIYNIDLFNSTKTLIQQTQATGKKVICYFSAGTYENFRDDTSRFLVDEIGKKLDGWEDENWLDIRSSNVRSIMKSRLDLARQKGCDGVEPDNMDGYINDSGFNLTSNDQLAYNRFIANEAHARGLSVGLKNDLVQVDELVDYYDFAINEQCFEYTECDALSVFIKKGKPVLNAEYLDKYSQDATERDALCHKSTNMKFSTLILPINLDDSFRFSCL